MVFRGVARTSILLTVVAITVYRGGLVQRDSAEGVDLTADPRQRDPSPGAKVVRLARRRRPPDDDLDLADHEDPPGAGITVHRTVYREASKVSFEIRLWKVVNIGFEYDVQGPSSWAGPLCAIVLLVAVVAAILVPNAILPSGAPTGLRVAIAAGSEIAVLVAGALFYRLRKKS